MSDITLSAGVRANLQSLQNIATLLTTSQNRLATGKKVNGALDNPTNYFVAQGLSDRAGGLNALLDGINNGISTVQAASKGLDSIYKAIQGAEGLIDKAKADSGKVSNQLRGTAVVNNATTLIGSLGYATNDTITFTDNVTSAATTVNLGTLTASSNVQDLINTINAQGSGVYSAALNNGNLTINSNGANAFTVTGSDAGAITATFGATSVSVTGGSYDQEKLDSYAVQFNEILTSIDQFAADSSFNGVNLLQAGNDLTVNYNEDGTTSTVIQSRQISAANFALTTIPTAGAATLTDFTNKISALKDALGDVRRYQGEYTTKLATMQNRQDFSKSVVNILKTGSDNLTLADANEEAANVLALQTRQALSQSALSLAVQADQSVLQLLK